MKFWEHNCKCFHWEGEEVVSQRNWCGCKYFPETQTLLKMHIERESLTIRNEYKREQDQEGWGNEKILNKKKTSNYVQSHNNNKIINKMHIEILWC